MFGCVAAAPANIAHKLSDLLLQFPNAAIDGVQWSVLVRRFEERHSTKFDISAFGFDSPLAAAPALLWDVARICDVSNDSDPRVALEDGIALMPRPGCMGSWPSLYRCLCDIVVSANSRDGEQPAILLSQLKPLLQRQWHANIDEQWGYLDSKGSSIKTKKMKHLIQSILKWRNERVCAQTNRKSSQIDEALFDELELVPSKKHNDLLLRLVAPVQLMDVVVTHASVDASLARCVGAWADADDADCVDDDYLRMDLRSPYDDPFEPPPQKADWASLISTPSTMCSTPIHFIPHSGSSTPMSQQPSAFTFMPFMLCNLVSSAGSAFIDVCAIPTGTVQQLRTQIEGVGSTTPLAPASQWAWK